MLGSKVLGFLVLVLDLRVLGCLAQGAQSKALPFAEDCLTPEHSKLICIASSKRSHLEAHGRSAKSE